MYTSSQALFLLSLNSKFSICVTYSVFFTTFTKSKKMQIRKALKYGNYQYPWDFYILIKIF